MSAFLHPGLLWFLPLIAVPILLHLLTLHRLRTVELSTFRFLFDSYVQQRRRMRFLEALLAALRALFLLFLVFVVSRPVVKHWDLLFGGVGAGGDVIMLVDCSASMNANTAGTSAMDRAKQVSLAVAEQLKPDDRLTLVKVTSQPHEAFSRFSSDAEAIRDEIDALEAGPSRANFFAALNLVFGPQAAKRTKPTVYLFTDCQASGWREVADQPFGRLIPADARFMVVNVGSQEAVANRAVVGSAPRESRAIAGLPVVLRPRVANYSDQTQEVPLSVIVEQKEVARTTLSLKPGESASREIVFVPREPGVIHGRFEIPSDRFPDDDDFLFTLNVNPQVTVLVVNGAPAADPFEDETLYLRTALASTVEEETAAAAAEAQGDPPADAASLLPKQDFLRSLDVRQIPEGELNPETLRDARVVILANCGSLNQQHFEWLRDYVAKGGGLLILPGDKVLPTVYNDQFFAPPGPQQELLTPVRLGAPEGDAENTDAFERLASVDYAHPVLSVFEDADARYLSTVYFYRRFPLEVPAGAANAWAVAKFANGKPALVESRFGDGVVQVAAFPANARWSNLPLKPEFVPLMLRLMSHLERRPDLEAPAVVPADAPLEIAISETWAPATGKVTDMAGRSEPLTFTRTGRRFAAAYERTSEKGFYTVQVLGGRSQQEIKGTTSFAVNLSSDESKFDLAGEDQFREWLPNVDLTVLDASAEQQQLLGGVGGQPNEIWRPLILLMFVIIVAEFLLATLSGGKTDEEEPVTVFQRIRHMSPGRWAGRMTGAGAEKALAE